MPDRDPVPWWDFVGHRRKVVTDPVWFGGGLVIVGICGLPWLGSWGRWLGVLVALAGFALLRIGLRRRLRPRR
ncbi:MAG: hypothetical protein ACM30G_10170 [Micromonosporaceae bacterium]